MGSATKVEFPGWKSGVAKPALALVVFVASLFASESNAAVTLTPTSSPTPIAGCFQCVNIGVYNREGALVFSCDTPCSLEPVDVSSGVLAYSGGGNAIYNGEIVSVTFNETNGSPGCTAIWNGDNNSGQAVPAGIYYLEISTLNAYGQQTTVTDAITVLWGPPPTRGPLSKATAPPQANKLPSILWAPVPAHSGRPMTLTLGKPGQSAVCTVLNLAGQRLGDAVFNGQSASLSTNGLAPGIYLLQTTVTFQDGSTQNQVQKIAIIR